MCIYIYIVCVCIYIYISVSSVAQLFLTLWPHGLQHARPPCPLPTPGACSNSCPLSWWCHPAISSSIVPFSSCLQSYPTLGSFPVSQFFSSGGQSIGASASVLPMNLFIYMCVCVCVYIYLNHFAVHQKLNNIVNQLYFNKINVELKISHYIIISKIVCQ